MNLEDIISSWNGCICSSGSSDFSTAQMTIVNNGSAEYEGHITHISTVPWGEVLDETFFVDAGNSETYTCVLYKGTATFMVVPAWTATVEGDAELVGGMVNITGDCAITLTNATPPPPAQ